MQFNAPLVRPTTVAYSDYSEYSEESAASAVESATHSPLELPDVPRGPIGSHIDNLVSSAASDDLDLFHSCEGSFGDEREGSANPPPLEEGRVTTVAPNPLTVAIPYTPVTARYTMPLPLVSSERFVSSQSALEALSAARETASQLDSAALDFIFELLEGEGRWYGILDYDFEGVDTVMVDLENKIAEMTEGDKDKAQAILDDYNDRYDNIAGNLADAYTGPGVFGYCAGDIKEFIDETDSVIADRVREKIAESEGAQASLESSSSEIEHDPSPAYVQGLVDTAITTSTHPVGDFSSLSTSWVVDFETATDDERRASHLSNLGDQHFYNTGPLGFIAHPHYQQAAACYREAAEAMGNRAVPIEVLSNWVESLVQTKQLQEASEVLNDYELTIAELTLKDRTRRKLEDYLPRTTVMIAGLGGESIAMEAGRATVQIHRNSLLDAVIEAERIAEVTGSDSSLRTLALRRLQLAVWQGSNLNEAMARSPEIQVEASNGLLEKAKRQLDRLLSRDQQDAESHMLKGFILLAQARNQQRLDLDYDGENLERGAANHFSRAAEITPTNSDAAFFALEADAPYAQIDRQELKNQLQENGTPIHNYALNDSINFTEAAELARENGLTNWEAHVLSMETRLD